MFDIASQTKLGLGVGEDGLKVSILGGGVGGSKCSFKNSLIIHNHIDLSNGR